MLGVEVTVCELHIETGANVEARARSARYEALHDLRSTLPEHPRLVTGHTQDDQAETVLLRLIRGTGVDGVASMEWEDSNVLRPLLDERRSSTRQYCLTHALPTVEDPMNSDARFQRVRIRKEVIPLLNEVASRDVVPLLARFAENAASHRAALSELTDHVPASLKDGFPLAGTADISNAALAALLRAWWGYPSLSAAALRRVMDVARYRHVAAQVTAGEQVQRVAGALVRVRSEQ